MGSSTLKTLAAASCVALSAGALLGGCNEKEQGVDEPAREGLALDLGGVEYNVFITRQLNLKIPPDSAYYNGPEPKKGFTLYGVFLQVCNNGKKARQTASVFEIEDNQGNKFEPTALPADNAFAYQPRKLLPQTCIPEAGSVAERGPTAGSMLLFELPLDKTENRPLELKVRRPFDPEQRQPDELTFELDI